MVSIRAEMKGIGGGFQICWNFLYKAKLNFSGCKICFKYVIFWGSNLTCNFPSAKLIHIWQLSLITIDWLAKSSVFEDIGNFIKSRHFFYNNEKSKKCHNSENYQEFVILIAACRPCLNYRYTDAPSVTGTFPAGFFPEVFSPRFFPR